MFLSVVIMAYSRKIYLKNAISSVLYQTIGREHFEIILIKNFNDADIDAFAEKNDVKVISGGAAPIGEYIHTALEKASGDVVCFLDDDDAFEPDKLTRIYYSFIEHPDLVYYKNQWSLVGQSGETLHPPRANAATDQEIRYFDAVHAIRFENRVYRWNMSCISVRKEIFEGFDNFVRNIQSGQDISLFYLAASRGGLFAHDRKMLTKYRWHQASMTKIKGEENDSYREYQSLRELPKYVTNPLLKEDITRTVTKLRVLSIWDGSACGTEEIRNLLKTALSFTYYDTNDLKLVALSAAVYLARLLMGATAIGKLRKSIDLFWTYEGKF